MKKLIILLSLIMSACDNLESIDYCIINPDYFSAIKKVDYLSVDGRFSYCRNKKTYDEFMKLSTESN